MEKHTQKIKNFSGVVYILLQIAFWSMIAVSAFVALAYVLELSKPYISGNLPGVTVTLPAGHQIGNTRVLLPEFTFSGYGLSFVVDTMNVCAYVISLIVLACARRVFNTLRREGTPFRADVVNGFKRLAVAMLIVGVFGGIVGFVGAAVVAVLCFIFDYGAALQQESDTTL